MESVFVSLAHTQIRVFSLFCPFLQKDHGKGLVKASSFIQDELSFNREVTEKLAL